MTLIERITAKYQEIEAAGATVGKLVCGAEAAQSEGIHATSFDLGFAAVEVEFVEGSTLALQKIVTTLEGV